VQESGRQVFLKCKTPRPSTAATGPEQGRSGLRVHKRRPTVCILSSHPVVLTHLDQAVDKKQFHVVMERLKHFTSASDPEFVLPQAPLYLLDAMAPRPESASLVQTILHMHPGSYVLLVTERDVEDDCFELLLLGARGLLSHDEASEHLSQALKCLAAGGFWLSPFRLSRFVDSLVRRHHSKPAVSPLSRREQEILEKLFQNFSNKEIASELNISERTVKFHVSNLLQKFRVSGRMELVLSYGSVSPTGLFAGNKRRSSSPHAGDPDQSPREREVGSAASSGKHSFFSRVKEDHDILPGSQHRRPAYSVS
jgi:DNA-binding NarL/FixJ family response regulator